MSHRYQVGQMLEMRATPGVSNRPAGPCQVVFCLPHDSGPVLYRVKAAHENNDRVVAETDLSPSSRQAPSETTETRPLTIAVARR